MLVCRLSEQVLKDTACALICRKGLFVDDALWAVDVPRVTIESIHAWLQSLLDHILLHYQVRFAPVLNEVSDEGIFAEIDVCDRTPIRLLDDLKDELWRDNTFTFISAFGCLYSWDLTLITHLLVYEGSHIKDGHRLFLDDELLCRRVRINKPIARVLVVRMAYVSSSWEEKLHPVLLGNLCHLVDRSVASHNRPTLLLHAFIQINSEVKKACYSLNLWFNLFA